MSRKELIAFKLDWILLWFSYLDAFENRNFGTWTHFSFSDYEMTSLGSRDVFRKIIERQLYNEFKFLYNIGEIVRSATDI